MGPKRRMILSDTSDDEEDSFKHRRTSLRVNLSYANLTDSGNGSLWKTETENEEVPHKLQASKELSRSKTKSTKSQNRSQFECEEKDNHVASKHATSDNNKMSGSNEYRIKGVQLKDFSIHLEDISTKERALETNCKRLKDAILSKTNEVFDKEHELSIKITKVLRNEDNRCDANAENESVLELNKTPEHAFNIIETPSHHHNNTTKKRRSSPRELDKFKLPHRQLFDNEDKQEEEQTRCRIIENVILKNPSVNLLRQSEQSSSPILSGSKRLSLLRKRSRDRTSKLNNTYSTICSIQSGDIGTPIVCSTFIEDNATDDKKVHQTVTNHPNNDVSSATQTINTVISMEMTKTYGDNRASEKYECLQNRNPSPTNCIEKEMEKCKENSWSQSKSASMQKLKDVSNSRSVVKRNVESSDDSHCTDDEDEASVCEDTVMPGGKFVEQVAMIKKTCETRESNNKTKIETERRRTSSLSKSSETIRSSLNVNTSLDAVADCDRDKNVNKLRRKLIILDDQRESTSTVRTSLQVNTSTDPVRRPSGRSNVLDRSSLPQDRHDPVEKDRSNNQYAKVTENRESDNVDVLENISLFERLRNVSGRKQVSCNQSTISGNQKTNECKNAVNGKSQNNTRASGDSCVEATPYPISRSVLFKTMLKHKAENAENNTSPCSNDINLNVDNGKKSDVTKLSASIPKSQNKAPVLTGTSKTVGTDTVILDGSLSGDPFIVTQGQSLNCKSLAIRSQSFDYDPCVVTRNKSVTENKSDKAANLEVKETKNSVDLQNIEHAPCTKVGKRKLLSMNDGSELCSITPIDENKCPVMEKSPVKRIKKLKKKKLLNFKKDTNIDEHKKTNKSMLSDSDNENKKQQDKKKRKPRKVISKKIVVKKLAENNMLNILEKENLIQNKRNLSGESRDSLDEFVKFRTTKPIQRNNYKSHKIIIVTTGLSKGDKSLVKSIVKSLGNAEMELNVSKRTTHVVSSGVRTVNLLRGIIRGCWLVTLEWVLKSLESNRWLNPEEFEMKHFSKAVQENRRDRQLFGPSYIPELFTTCGFVYVEHKTTVPCATLKELIKTAGGHITENIKLAKIIIGPSGLRETWVIDSITTGDLQLTQLYKRQ